jgi:hypothetical protein
MIHTKNTKNNDIRNEIKSAKLLYWEVTAALSISDGTFSRKLREELPPAEKEKIIATIKTLAKEEEVNA